MIEHLISLRVRASPPTAAPAVRPAFMATRIVVRRPAAKPLGMKAGPDRPVMEKDEAARG